MVITPFSDVIEQPKDERTVGIFTGSINTSAFDAYRQGVELTLEKHYQMGNVKISSGFENHEIQPLVFGQNQNITTDVAFKDLDLFDPVKYIRAQELDTDVADVITFPIKLSDSDQRENTNLDGVIEPLTIRAKAAFFSIEVPFESHDIAGEFCDGNSDAMRANSQITQFYDLPNCFTFQYISNPTTTKTVARSFGFLGGERKPAHPEQYYLDAFETMGNITLPVAMNIEQIKLQPFVDGLTVKYNLAPSGFPSAGFDISAPTWNFNGFEISKGITVPFRTVYLHRLLSIGEQLPFFQALTAMSSSSDNYVPNKKRSMPTGYTFENVPAGIDSLAFGGMTY